MRITGVVVTSPDVVAARAAWDRLDVGLDITIESGEAGLAAMVLGVEDVITTERLLQRRGLPGDASGFDLDGTTWRLEPDTGETGAGLELDHVVVDSGDAVRSAADYGARLGLDLRLDRVTEYGYHGLFFRCGDSVVEVIVLQDRDEGPSKLGGLAWRCPDIEATRARLAASGVDASEVREGRKPGTRVVTVRDLALGVPTLLIEPSALV